MVQGDELFKATALVELGSGGDETGRKVDAGHVAARAGGNGTGWTTGTAAYIEKTQRRVQRQPSGKALCRRQATDMELIIWRQYPGCQLAGVMSLRSKRGKDPFGKAAPAVMLLDGFG